MDDETTPPDNATAHHEIPDAHTGILADSVDHFACTACGARIDVKDLPPFSSITCKACGAATTVPVKLGNFLLLRLIGTGGMGGVYFARDEQLSRNVAIKVMLQSLGDDPQFIETFRHEAQAVAKLNHANIAQIYSFGQEKGQPYIVMELVSGERVDELMERPGGLSKMQVLRIGLEISQGLSAADEAGLVHGDIKPENILLDKKENAKLVDFGLATVAHQNAGEGIWGTPYYIAPEKIRRQKLDARSDIYSLGATLFHMLTGQPPFEGETPVEVVKARLDAPAPDPSDIDPEIPPLVTEIIQRMLAPERNDRYPNYRSLISDLRKALQVYETEAATKAPTLSGGKSIRIKKRGSNFKPPADPNKDAAEASDASGKKLIIHKSNSSRIRATGHFSTPTTIIDPPELSEEERAERRERKRKKHRRIRNTILILLALIVSTGGGLLYWQSRTDRLADQRERYERQAIRQQAAARAVEITTNRKRVERALEQIKPLADNVRESAERMNITILLPEPQRAAALPPPQPGAETTEAQAAEEQPQEEQPQEDVDDAPIAAEETQEPPKPAAAVRQTPESDLVHQALGKERELEALVEQTKQFEKEAQERADRITGSISVRAAQTLIEEIEGVHTLSASAVTQAQGLARELQDASRRLAELRHRFEVAEQRRIEAEREAQRLEEQRAAEERARKEREETARREIAQIPNLERSVRNLLDVNAFTEAYEQLQTHTDDFTTDEGRAAFGHALERHRYLAAMKMNIIRGIETSPFPWGYGFGATARDITGASLRGLQVQGTSTPIPWESLQPPQMLKLVDRYIESRDLNARERLEVAFGAAIYSDLFGEQGRERARYYAIRAMDMGLNSRIFEQVLESRWDTAQTNN